MFHCLKKTPNAFQLHFIVTCVKINFKLGYQYYFHTGMETRFDGKLKIIRSVWISFVGEDQFQVRKQFVRSGAKEPARLCFFKRHKQFFRLAPTSKKVASHLCLISLNRRQECTVFGSLKITFFEIGFFVKCGFLSLVCHFLLSVMLRSLSSYNMHQSYYTINYNQ